MERLFSSWWHCWWRSQWSSWWWWISNSRVNIQSAIIVDRGCTYNRLRLRICVNMSMLCIEEGPCVCILHTMKMCVHCTIQCIYTVHYTIQCINTMDLLNNPAFYTGETPAWIGHLILDRGFSITFNILRNELNLLLTCRVNALMFSNGFPAQLYWGPADV